MYSESFISLGKKCYIDVIVCEKENGEKMRHNHIRMKGIPIDSIILKCE